MFSDTRATGFSGMSSKKMEDMEDSEDEPDEKDDDEELSSSRSSAVQELIWSCFCAVSMARSMFRSRDPITRTGCARLAFRRRARMVDMCCCKNV